MAAGSRRADQSAGAHSDQLCVSADRADAARPGDERIARRAADPGHRRPQRRTRFPPELPRPARHRIAATPVECRRSARCGRPRRRSLDADGPRARRRDAARGRRPRRRPTPGSSAVRAAHRRVVPHRRERADPQVGRSRPGSRCAARGADEHGLPGHGGRRRAAAGAWSPTPGMATQVGAIAQAVQAVGEGPTPFQREVGRWAARITLDHRRADRRSSRPCSSPSDWSLLETFVAAVALAVAAIPEGLPVVHDPGARLRAPAACSSGTRWCGRYPWSRSVGGADIVFTDKTGTRHRGSHEPAAPLHRWRGCSRSAVAPPTARPASSVDAGGATRSGRTWRCWLLVCATTPIATRRRHASWATRPRSPSSRAPCSRQGRPRRLERIEELPFSSERKRMSVVVVRGPATSMSSPREPRRSSSPAAPHLDAGRRSAATSTRRSDRACHRDANERLTGQAFRVLALAGKRGSTGAATEPSRPISSSTGWPPSPTRPAPPQVPALQARADAGIRVVMITGDNPAHRGSNRRARSGSSAHDRGLELDSHLRRRDRRRGRHLRQRRARSQAAHPERLPRSRARGA